jgi:trk system potassium uptake protein TrkA
MKIVIVGCGRVGAAIAETYDRGGHEVVIIDISTSAFDRLPSSFRGEAIRGDGTDEDVLRRAGAEGADVFLALTEGDNRNVMAAQLAAEALSVGRVIAKINDPVRAAAYSVLGIATLCRTGLMMDAVDTYLGLPKSGLPGMLAPSGSHHDGHGSTDAEQGGTAGAGIPGAVGAGVGAAGAATGGSGAGGPGTGAPSASSFESAPGAAPVTPAMPAVRREV